jgi:hypothetical protein
MIVVATLLAVSLLIPAVADPGLDHPRPSIALPHMSTQQKRAAIKPLEDTANACIARRVSADPRYRALAQAGDVNELIVDSVPSCVDAVRAMIDAHDRVFGEGAGEMFFMGPYLDALPGAIDKLVGEAAGRKN